MATNTTKLQLFKWNVDEDGKEKFNIEKSMNENWDKIDQNATNITSEINTIKSEQTTQNTDISTLKTDNTTNKTNISTLQTDNETNKTNISALQTDNNTNKTNISTLSDNKVDKVSGKGLSTNDYTTTEKNKLSGIETGSQVNKIESIKVNGTAQTITNKAVDITVPTKLSELTNDGNFVTDASYVHTDNNYTSTEKTKLNGIATGAQVNVIESVKVNGTAQTVTNKEVNVTVPTNNNQLTNGAGYQTASDVETAITSKGYQTSSQVETAITSKGYQTSTDVDNAIEKVVGSAPQALDTLQELASALGNDENFSATMVTELAKKVDKVNGKDLFSGSYNDLTNKPDLTTYENKIETVKVNGTAQTTTSKAVNITVPTKVSDLTNDSKYQTESQINTALANKVDKVEGKGLSTNDLTDELKTKIENAGDSSFSGNYNDLVNKPDLSAYENKIESIKVNGTTQTITDKVVDITVPTKTSDLTNDSRFITGYTETDPTVPNHVKSITQEDINNWNNSVSGSNSGSGIKIYSLSDLFGSADVEGTISGMMANGTNFTVLDYETPIDITGDLEEMINNDFCLVTVYDISDTEMTILFEKRRKTAYGFSEQPCYYNNQVCGFMTGLLTYYADNTAEVYFPLPLCTLYRKTLKYEATYNEEDYSTISYGNKQKTTMVEIFSMQLMNGDSTKISKLLISCKTVNDYTLPTASASVLGGIKIGQNLSIASDGTVSATVPTNNNQLTNGAGYQTSSDVETAITSKGYQTASQVEAIVDTKIGDINTILATLTTPTTGGDA